MQELHETSTNQDIFKLKDMRGMRSFVSLTQCFILHVAFFFFNIINELVSGNGFK